MSADFSIAIPNDSSVDEQIPARFLDDPGTAWWMERLRANKNIRLGEIGESREGRTLYGLMVGEGDHYCSITAGAHADEPAGPVTACIFAEWLAGDSDVARQLREDVTFMICPQVNPDGAERNKAWFAAVPDFETYLRHVVREGPGDDIEFGYPFDDPLDLDEEIIFRPENMAVADFLETGFPYYFHTSLHSMAFAEGAWFLLEESMTAKTKAPRMGLTDIALHHGFKLHDIDRQGEKGFTRIAPGFCTTPTAMAMMEYFEYLGDLETAKKFCLSSMEFVGSESPNALIMVTELPVFSIMGGYEAGRRIKATVKDYQAAPGPKPGETAYEKFRNELKVCMALEDYAAAVELGRRYQLEPVPFAAQCELQYWAVRMFGTMAAIM